MTQIFGILNITPDSFSDGGLYTKQIAILNHIKKLKAEGVDIIDIGAQATGPNSSMLGEEEELYRLKSALQYEPILLELSSIPFSIDTYHWRVAEAGLKAGASYINDISGLRYSPEMSEVIRDFKAKAIVMHSKEGNSAPHASNLANNSKDILQTVKDFFKERIDSAQKCNLDESKLILDPGMGKFVSLDPSHSLELIEKYHELKEEFPKYSFLYGLSRKGFISELYPEVDKEIKSKQLELDLIKKGVEFIRTHDIKSLKDLITMNTHTYYLALGGNIGDTKATFKSAVEELNKIGQGLKLSKIYKSKPLPTTHGIKQDPYLNAVVRLESPLTPSDMLKRIQLIEENLGRDRVNYIHWGPRTLDIDIVSCDDLVIENPNLSIPHPRMLERDFVLLPIYDIDPDYTHPISKIKVDTLISNLNVNQKFIDQVIE